MEDGSFEGACGDGTPRGIDLNHSRSGGYGSGTMDRSLSASGTFIILEIVVGTLRLFALPERRRQQFKEIRRKQWADGRSKVVKRRRSRRFFISD